MLCPTTEIQEMAGKKKKVGRPETPGGPKRQIVGLRGTDAYKAWLVEFAEAQRSDVADLIDDALEAYAKEQGFKAPPKR